MRKQNPNVQLATENTPTEQMIGEKGQSETARQPNNVEIVQGEKTDVQKKLSQAERIELLEAQLKQADENFTKIGQFFEKLQPLMTLSDQIQARQAQAQPASAPNQFGGLEAFLPEIMKLFSGSSTGNDAFAELGKEALRSQIEMSKAITNAVVSKVIGKASSDVAEVVTGEKS